MTAENKNRTNLPDPTPGVRTLEFWASFLLGAAMLYFGKNDNDYNRAIYVLATAGTFLLTNNRKAHFAAASGGVVRACFDTSPIGALGFLVQGSAVLFAVKDTMVAANKLAKHYQPSRSNLTR